MIATTSAIKIGLLNFIIIVINTLLDKLISIFVIKIFNHPIYIFNKLITVY